MRLGTRTLAMAAFAFLLVPALSANNNTSPTPKAADEPANSAVAPRAATSPASAEKAPDPANPSPQSAQGAGSSNISGTARGRGSTGSDDVTPRAELFLGYSYLRGAPRNVGNRIVELNGGTASLAYNFNDWFGLAADFGGYADSRLILNGPGSASREVHSEGKVFTFLVGPQLSYRKYRRLTPFAQVLVGVAHASDVTIDGCTGVPGCTALPSETAFALAAGGGLDLNLSRHFAIRLLQAEYVMTYFNDVSAGATGRSRQNDVRLSAGIVFRFGGSQPPPPVNHPPMASCSADKTIVYAGSGESVTFTGTASDPDNDSLNYSWSASGGRVEGSGPQVRWLSDGAPVGVYTVTLRVDDGMNGTADCSGEVRVEAMANREPTLSCSVDRSAVFAGERVHITGVASDPDGDQLTYTWRANSGQVLGTGSAVDWDSTGLAPGSYTITGRVDDGRGGAADCSSTVEVKAAPPPPMASKINECAFGRPMSTRIDNVCKRILDDVALRLQNEPRATAVIIGYSDPQERNSEKIAADRSNNAVEYLGEKGIDASRITTRTGAGNPGETDNRRDDIIWVPEGATY